MIELFYEMVCSNLIFASALAFIACLVSLFGKRPRLAYFLWLFVFIKLVTPSLLPMPGIKVPPIEFTDSSVEITNFIAPFEATMMVSSEMKSDVIHGEISLTSSLTDSLSIWIQEMDVKGTLVFLSLFVSAVILIVSLSKALRFHFAMMSDILPAPEEVQSIALELAGVIGLKKQPKISMTSADVSPMVWWVGGSVHVILPASIMSKVKLSDLRWVLAHELTHVKRGDHMVRWLEWLASGLWWWNPIVWCARKQLRVNEELCCDADVLSSQQLNSSSYAKSILKVVENLVSPSLHSPAMVSELNSGGELEQRIKNILNQSRSCRISKHLQTILMLLAFGLMPLGFTYAQENTEITSDITKLEITEVVPEVAIEEVLELATPVAPAAVVEVIPEIIPEVTLEDKSELKDTKSVEVAKQVSKGTSKTIKHKGHFCKDCQKIHELKDKSSKASK